MSLVTVGEAEEVEDLVAEINCRMQDRWEREDREGGRELVEGLGDLIFAVFLRL